MTIVAADGSLTYTARFGCASSVADCAAATLKVDIPAPLFIVDSPPIGGFVTSSSLSGNSLSFKLADPLTAGSSGSIAIQVQAPSCKPIGSPAPGPLVANESSTMSRDYARRSGRDIDGHTPALSFGLVYQPATPLAPGEKLHISLRTRLNGSVPAPKATALESWNSIAYTATLIGLNGPFTLLTGEPLKVGVRFADPAYTASIGGVVWKDFDANGIGDEGSASNLEGIGVAVFDSAGVIVTTVYTDKNGVYELAGLTPNDNYRLELSLEPGVGTLDGYFVSPANASADPLLNSHATQTATKAVISCRTGAAGTVDMNNNVGAAKTNPPT